MCHHVTMSWRLIIALVGSTLGLVVLAIVVVSSGEKVIPRLRETDPLALAALVGLTVAALLARTSAWNQAVGRANAGVPLRRADAHGLNGAVYLATVVVPPYLANLLRIAFVRGLNLAVLTGPQLIIMDALLLWTEACLHVPLLLVLLFGVSVPWWAAAAILLAVTVTGVVVAAVWRRHREHPWARVGRILLDDHQRSRFVSLLALVLVCQIVRNWIALDALGLEGTLVTATALFVLTNVTSLVPAGGGPAIVVAAAILFGGDDLSAAVAVGLLLTGTYALGAIAYGVPALVRATPRWIHHVPSPAAHADPEADPDDPHAREQAIAAAHAADET